MGVDTYYEDLDLTLRHEYVTLELKGAAGWFNTVRSWNEVVTVDGVPFAKIGGDMVPEGGGPTITPAGPFLLTSDQRQLLFDVVNTPGMLGSELGRVLGVARRLV